MHTGTAPVMVSRAAIEGGADWLAVALAEEARELRQNGITAPILVLGPSSKWQWEVASELGISMVCSFGRLFGKRTCSCREKRKSSEDPFEGRHGYEPGRRKNR